MNNVKKLIQKEEYIAIAINKYILQTGKIPKKSDSTLNWSALLIDDYLGQNFNKHNPMTKNDLIVKFDTSNNVYILGVFEKKDDFNSKHKYLYNFYTNKLFRVNTIPPKTKLDTDLEKGSHVLYKDEVKDIIKVINDNKYLNLDSEKCETKNNFYQLKDGKLIYSYCKDEYVSFPVYQEEPIFVEDSDDLAFIKSKIGSRAYAKKNGNWFEYYYQGDMAISWVPVDSGSILNSQDEEEDIEDRIISYIPDSKDLVLRKDYGCMLANGDIFCWGNNKNKKSGIETSGQLDPNLTPDYINTPVMLKVQIDNITKITDNSNNEYTRRDKRWYNNPYRVKFEKMAVNSTNVCGVSPIFDYFQSGVYKKFGGDIYCNGSLTSSNFEDISSSASVITTSILKRNKFIATGKEDQTNDGGEIYLKDVALVDGTIAVLSDDGNIYTMGSNEKGALGIDNMDETFYTSTPLLINNSGVLFKKLFALRSINCFGALDESNNFYLWGERTSATNLYKPTILSNRYDPDGIFVNDKDFILRKIDKNYVRTYDVSSVKALTDVPKTALSASIYDSGSNEKYLFIDENRQLQGSSELKSCRDKNNNSCTSNDDNIFNLGFDKLNELITSTNNVKYASFSNISVFHIPSNVLTTPTVPTTTNPDKITLTPLTFVEKEDDIGDKDKEKTIDDFEGNIDGWIKYDPSDPDNNDSFSEKYEGDQSDPEVTTFLGRISGYKLGEYIRKRYYLGPSYANKEVTLSFDLLQIDNWDGTSSESGDTVSDSITFFIHGHGVKTMTLISDDNSSEDIYKGQKISIAGTRSTEDEKHHVILHTRADNQGRVVLGMAYTLGSLSDESWGIDNITIHNGHVGTDNTLPPAPVPTSSPERVFVCAMTGFGSKSQMYCWGNVGRSLPILSTSLYDVSKIDNMNKLFVSQTKDAQKQMSYDEFNNSGNLFLKYPTYIGGFDYEFYFK